MELKIGDYVEYRFMTDPNICKIGKVVKITYGEGKIYPLYNISWIKAYGLISTEFQRKELRKVSEKEAVIEML